MALFAATAAAFALCVTLLLRTLARLIRRRVTDAAGLGMIHLLFRQPAFSADRRSLALAAIAVVCLGAVFAILAGLFP